MVDGKRRRSPVRARRAVGSNLPSGQSTPTPAALITGQNVLFSDSESALEEDFPSELPSEDDDEGEDLVGSDMERDYRINPALDTYDAGSADEEEYDPMDPETRRRADAALNRRDAQMLLQTGKKPNAYFFDDDDHDVTRMPQRRRRRALDNFVDYEMDDDMGDIAEQDLSDPKTSTIFEWLLMPNVRLTVERQFRKFLHSFSTENAKSYYGNRISEIAIANKETLEINYTHLASFSGDLARYLLICPSEMLKIFEGVALQATLSKFPEYGDVHQEIHVRVTDMPVSNTLVSSLI